MVELDVLGNAAAVPIVITITQLLKKNFKVKNAAPLLALGVSLGLCLGWELYTIDEDALLILSQSSFIIQARWAVSQLIIGFATWLSASKLYDMGYGEKIKDKEFAAEKKSIVKEKERLLKEVIKLKNGNGGKDGPMEEDPEVAAKLLEILEKG